ncbi:hypothetical protein FRB94_000851 [Tulasnella sp. JGI-2019a]|nr:hypothetical protein FRB94_000851 [Tulasnella sp. JGI-2019a]KAG9035792.1 hypothetical protein FRB95_010560 [Tulasnella sp. JGI-2019a]
MRQALQIDKDESTYFSQQQETAQKGKLFMGRAPRKGGLRQTNLPQLRSISAMGLELLILAPGQPVKSLTLLRGMDGVQAEQVWTAVSTSTGPLTHVTLRWYRWTNLQATIRAMGQHLPQLQSLSLERLWGHILFATEVSQSLSSLEHLPKLHIELWYSNGCPPAWIPAAWANLRFTCPNVDDTTIIQRGNLE